MKKQHLIPLFSVAVIMSAFGTLGAEQVPKSSRPNIIILYADDMGYGDMSCQNPSSKIQTPNLDKLAAEGTRFTDGHSSCGVCSPSRYAMLLGRSHWRGMDGIVNSFEPPVIQAQQTTVAEMLKAEGYHTACIGKWHLGWNWTEIMKAGATPSKASNKKGKTAFGPEDFDWSRPVSGGPCSHGFDYYFGDDVPNFPPYAWIEKDRLITTPSAPFAPLGKVKEGGPQCRPGPMTPGWDITQVVPKLADRAVEWIREQKGSKAPFFIYVPFNSPHAPIVPADSFDNRSKAGAFGDFVAQTDDIAGRILQAVKECGFEDNTLVVFSSDNGPERFAYARMEAFNHQSAGPLRGVKRDLYEGGHRMPFIVKWPGKVKAGAVSDALVSQVDLFATFAAIVGHDLPAGVAEDSYNLLPVLTSSAPSPRHVISYNTGGSTFGIRKDNWVLIANPTGYHSKPPAGFEEAQGYPKHDQAGELYDLSKDLGQKHNLYAEHPEKVKELTAILEEVRAKGQVR